MFNQYWQQQRQEKADYYEIRCRTVSEHGKKRLKRQRLTEGKTRLKRQRLTEGKTRLKRHGNQMEHMKDFNYGETLA
jgi:hypothetical protein